MSLINNKLLHRPSAILVNLVNDWLFAYRRIQMLFSANELNTLVISFERQREYHSG